LIYPATVGIVNKAVVSQENKYIEFWSGIPLWKCNQSIIGSRPLLLIHRTLAEQKKQNCA